MPVLLVCFDVACLAEWDLEGLAAPHAYSTTLWPYLPSDGHQASAEQALTSAHPNWLVSAACGCMWSTLSTAVNLGLSSFTALCWLVAHFLQQP